MVCHHSCKHAPWELQKCLPVLQARRREPPRCCKLAVESRRDASRPPMSTPPSCYKSAVDHCGGVASPSTMALPPCCKPVVGAPPVVVQVLMLQRWVADQRVPRGRARRCGGRRVLPCLCGSFFYFSFFSVRGASGCCIWVCSRGHVSRRGVGGSRENILWRILSSQHYPSAIGPFVF